MGLDRAAVPMDEALAAGAVLSTRRKARRKPYLRKAPDRVAVHYRMAYVGTISFHDADGAMLGSRCYTAAAQESPTERLVVPFIADLRHALRQDPTVAWG